MSRLPGDSSGRCAARVVTDQNSELVAHDGVFIAGYRVGCCC
ncbi:hypothetical protein I551_5728 [Mycobacterium ulcerans str. Harvey]|uniref:Uncharacterized protein n=1 Tax=Mycobacterium ulcerans str. Harvey TaxID=1299332 RepID=A0ABN0QSX7_MYCUL|nr:hypothetical protein I551_5728 [Mycobacterium ulcerans str. Harvey]